MILDETTLCSVNVRKIIMPGMYKIGKCKMQVNMYCGVLILFIVVSWVQSQSSTSTPTAATIRTLNPFITSTTPTSSPKTIATTSNSTTSLTKPVQTSTKPTSNPKTIFTTSSSTTNLNTSVAKITIPTSNPKTIFPTPSSTTNLTTTVLKSTTPTSNPKTIFNTSSSTTNLNTTVAKSTTPTSIPKAIFTTSSSTSNLNTTVANSTTPATNPKSIFTTSSSNTNLNTTVAKITMPTSNPKTIFATSSSTANLHTTVAKSTTSTSNPKTIFTTSSSTTNLNTTVANSTTPTSIPKTIFTTSSSTTNLNTTVANSTTPTTNPKSIFTTSSSNTNLNTTVAKITMPTSNPKTIFTTSSSNANLNTTVAKSTTPTSSTNTTITDLTGTTKYTTTVATSATHARNPDTMDVTTGTTHTFGLSTTFTATNRNSKVIIKVETSSRTQSPGTAKTTTPATSTVRVTVLGKIYINEVMVGRDVPAMVELFVTAVTNVSHYTLAVFDDSQNMVQSYQLNQQQDEFLNVTLNNTKLGSETNSVGIALYDTNLWIKKTLNNTDGLVDALVIGTSFQNTSATLIQILTPGCLPIVLQLNQASESKSITRCSEERACDSSMFIYTSSSFSKNNSAICEKRLKNMNTITLKFNCSCHTCDNTSINEIIHFLIQEIDKICHCEVTAINIMDSYVACCGGTALHATIVAADSEQEKKIMTAYKTLLQSITTITLRHNNYTISKECGSYCCHQTVLPTDSTNVKLRVAVTVTCIMVFLVIIIFVVLYRRRKKRGVHQFSMILPNEEGESLIMDGVEDDKNVGSQETTYDKIRLAS